MKFTTNLLLLGSIKQNKGGSYSYFVSANGLSFTLISKNSLLVVQKTTKNDKIINVIENMTVDVKTSKNEYEGNITYRNIAFVGFEKPKTETKELK